VSARKDPFAAIAARKDAKRVASARGVHEACNTIAVACDLLWERYGDVPPWSELCNRLLARVDHADAIAAVVAPELYCALKPPPPVAYVSRTRARKTHGAPCPHCMTRDEHSRLGTDLFTARVHLLSALSHLDGHRARKLVTRLVADLEYLRCELDDAECREHGTTDCYYGRERRVAPESTGEERREAWRVRHGVRQGARHPLYCPCLLGTRRLLCDKHRAVDPRDRGNECDPYRCCLTKSGFVDHARQWIRDGRRAFFTTETYLAHVPEGLAAIMAEHRIVVFLHPADEGWHCAPRCRLYVFMQRQDAAEYARLEPRAERL